MAEAKEDFKLFKRSYRDRHTGQPTETAAWYVEFRDHLNVRHRWPLFTSERTSHGTAKGIMELVQSRRSGKALTDDQTAFIETRTEEVRAKLVEAGIIDRQNAMRGGPLSPHLDDYHKALTSKGDTREHVALTIQRIKRVFDGCGFATCADLARPGAASSIKSLLGGLRTNGEINGESVNKYIGCIRGLLRWMADDQRIASNPLASLKKINNVEIDRERRREFSVDEVRYLLASVLKAKREWPDVPPTDRELLYRFVFETGMRPGQVRALTKASFDLDEKRPTVTSKSHTTKGRKAPEPEPIKPQMATDLRESFKAKVPTAPAFKMPSKYQLARMLRRDLKDAREAWIKEAGEDAQQRQRRHESDFLADVNRAGERADFYSLRHAHGSALADANVAPSAIQKSMNHVSGRTTERYVHVRFEQVAAARALLPDVKPMRMTGTFAGPAAAPSPQPMATRGDSKQRGEVAIFGQNRDSALPGRGGKADATDLKSGGNPTVSNGKQQVGSSAAPPAAPNPTPAPPEVAEIAAAWDKLAEPVKAAIMGMVRSVR